jgi:uncharacterized protein DUF1493
MASSPKNLELAVMEFVARETSARLSALSLDTRLREDLGVDGQDAADLFNDFSATFGVDLSSFHLSEHFGPEASFSGLRTIAESVTGKVRYSTSVRIRDLVKAARLNRWSE